MNSNISREFWFQQTHLMCRAYRRNHSFFNRFLIFYLENLESLSIESYALFFWFCSQYSDLVLFLNKRPQSIGQPWDQQLPLFRRFLSTQSISISFQKWFCQFYWLLWLFILFLNGLITRDSFLQVTLNRKKIPTSFNRNFKKIA